MQLFVSFDQCDDTVNSTERKLIDDLNAAARKHGYKVSCHGDAESTWKLLTQFKAFKEDLGKRIASGIRKRLVPSPN